MQSPRYSGNTLSRLEKGCVFNNLEELINEPTHVRDNGSQSCIDLICTGQLYFFTDSGVLLSLDTHSKHNIISYNMPSTLQAQIFIYHALHPTSTNFHIPCPPSYKHKFSYNMPSALQAQNFIYHALHPTSTNFHILCPPSYKHKFSYNMPSTLQAQIFI